MYFFPHLKVKLSPHLLDYEASDAKKDDKNDPNEVVESIQDHPPLGVGDLFRNPFVRKVTIIMFFNWIVVTLGNV